MAFFALLLLAAVTIVLATVVHLLPDKAAPTTTEQNMTEAGTS
jgi:hypothetical protein